MEWGLRNISSEELTEWMIFYAMEPRGEKRADVRLAYLLALIANANKDPRKGRAYTAEDFMLEYEVSEKEIGEDEMLAKIVAANIALGGVDLRENK